MNKVKQDIASAIQNHIKHLDGELIGDGAYQARISSVKGDFLSQTLSIVDANNIRRYFNIKITEHRS